MRRASCCSAEGELRLRGGDLGGEVRTRAPASSCLCAPFAALDQHLADVPAHTLRRGVACCSARTSAGIERTTLSACGHVDPATRRTTGPFRHRPSEEFLPGRPARVRSRDWKQRECARAAPRLLRGNAATAASGDPVWLPQSREASEAPRLSPRIVHRARAPCAATCAAACTPRGTGKAVHERRTRALRITARPTAHLCSPLRHGHRPWDHARINRHAS